MTKQGRTMGMQSEAEKSWPMLAEWDQIVVREWVRMLRRAQCKELALVIGHICQDAGGSTWSSV